MRGSEDRDMSAKNIQQHFDKHKEDKEQRSKVLAGLRAYIDTSKLKE
jgi:hypothetical protein